MYLFLYDYAFPYSIKSVAQTQIKAPALGRYNIYRRQWIYLRSVHKAMFVF